MKWLILENQSTTTMMESFCLCVRGSPTTKSRLTSSHGPSGTSNGIYKLAFKWWVFAMWQVQQRSTTQVTTTLIFGQKSHSLTSFNVFSLAKWPARAPWWPSNTMESHNEHCGTHNWIPLKRNLSCKDYPWKGVSLHAAQITEKSRSSGYKVVNRSKASTRTCSDVSNPPQWLRASATVFVAPDLCRMTNEKSCKNSTHLACRGFNLCCPWINLKVRWSENRINYVCKR